MECNYESIITKIIICALSNQLFMKPDSKKTFKIVV